MLNGCLCNAGNVKAVGRSSDAGSTKFKEREILVQHLLVPEDQLQLLLDIQRQVMQGLFLEFCFSSEPRFNVCLWTIPSLKV